MQDQQVGQGGKLVAPTAKRPIFERRIISLKDIMQQFNASRFFFAAINFQEAADIQIGTSPDEMPIDIEPSFMDSITGFKSSLKFHGFNSAEDKADEIIALISRPPVLRGTLKNQIHELNSRLISDTRRRFFLIVAQEDNKYVTGDESFGQDVETRFPTAIFDIGEAMIQMSFARHTAAVFHLMRAMEVALDAFRNHLGLQVRNNPNWGVILKEIEDKLKERHAVRDDSWKSKEPTLAAIWSTLNNVRDSWRNPTMHVGNFYSPDWGLEIFVAVRAFLRKAATNLPLPVGTPSATS